MDQSVKYLERPEGRIAYSIEGRGPLVVCIPGMGDLRSTYRFLVPAVSAAGFRVASMDLRGHGDSDATFSAYDDVAAGTDALALIEHLGGPAVLIGNSMGAGAAAWAAAESANDEDGETTAMAVPVALDVAVGLTGSRRVTGLVLVGPFVRNPTVSAWATLAFRLALLRPWGRAVWRKYYRTLYPGRRPVDLAEYQTRIDEGLRLPGHWHAFAATTHTSHEPVEKRLGDIRVPVLVIMGERDSDFPDPAAEARLISKRTGAEILMVPKAGHYPQAEYPEIVNPAVLDFIRRILGD